MDKLKIISFIPKQSHFDDYDSEEEEISKIIRSMINFADEEEDIKKIFTS